ncbi:MAG: DUF4926 domain-containing protein [Cyanobacterium sp. T60_A2020_053]|nr:DUF4926 domain-containing protein [Cyanobacterium sp. T60_A2020_053]
MNKPQLLDVIELLVDIPEFSLRKGEQGTILEDYEDGYFEVEFANKKGKTTALCTINQKNFMVVWCAETQKWITAITLS